VGRPARISPALEVLREVETLGPHLEWIVGEAPRAIVAGDEVETPFKPT
jgi:hypothetical protein